MALDFPGLLGDGVKLAYVNDASPPVTCRLQPLLDIPQVPAKEADELENTCHGSGGDHTYTLGLNKIPNITAKLLFDASDAYHLDMITRQAAKTVTTFYIEVPANAAGTTFLRWTLDAVVKKAAVSTPIAGLQEMDLELLYSANLVPATTPVASIIT